MIDFQHRINSIVIALFSDFAEIDENFDFFTGERNRFRHYFMFNKQTPLFLFEDELLSILLSCQKELDFYGEKSESTKKRINVSNEITNLSLSVKKLISQDKISDGLGLMEEFFEKKDQDTHNNIVLMMLKLKNAEKEKIKNLIEYSDYLRIKMQVANSTMEIINESLKR